jgi:hypothetical protein
LKAEADNHMPVSGTRSLGVNLELYDDEAQAKPKRYCDPTAERVPESERRLQLELLSETWIDLSPLELVALFLHIGRKVAVASPYVRIK